MTALYVDAAYLKAEITRLRTELPELAEDDMLREDMLAGETDLELIISRALDERREAETMAAAIKEREAALASRRARFEKKAEAMRSLVKSVMQAADLPKITLPEATISIQSPRASVAITDLDAIPQGYFRLKKEADKTAIKKAIEAGDKIPGAELALGEETLSIRTK
ncbi:siphovirus Gp157 family protein [Chelativorans sp. Marseille-P2723]|uniref:siphovirus Gp157 family protein n=1 Tax=Chelativorans sp. Marseille-P2723 TaxID=2709133 RepID=UPI00156F4DB4|nr:siphovirus Gp157 family protein [Chelativorans sp. Marseille-P2723]